MIEAVFGENHTVRFVNRDLGNDLDPIAILYNLAAGLSKVVVDVEERGEITTELKAFGAPEDGIRAVVGHDFFTHIYIVPMEKK